MTAAVAADNKKSFKDGNRNRWCQSQSD